MDLIIVTGMSGAGKSQAVSALEDIGFYCVDNVPPRLLSTFAEIPVKTGGAINKIALVVDVRSKDMFADFNACMDELRESNYSYKTLFLDCSDETLLRRYKETRRRHPLMTGENMSISDAIRTEREMLNGAKIHADYKIDTSQISTTQLRQRVRDLFLEETAQSMRVQCMSFGFKYGIPVDSDLVFDVRCLPNPFYEENLRELTGMDEPVRDYVLSFPQATELAPKLFSLIDYLFPLYIQEGKSQLVISIGCTGGRHRSVVFTELLAKHLKEKGDIVSTSHRDMRR